MIKRIRAYFRVCRGARLLDRKVPVWWWDVDPWTVDVLSFTKCPLGQIYGGAAYYVAIEGLGVPHDPDNFGFVCPAADWKYYNARWHREIRKRRKRSMRARMDGGL